jgi:uncharacterized protein GlcG (DUF336 family)
MGASIAITTTVSAIFVVTDNPGHHATRKQKHKRPIHQKESIRVSISIDVARKVAEGCRQRAQELRSPVSIAIVDAGGHLVLFERMMSPYGWATGDISIAKATTAVMFNQSTDEVAQWGSGIPGFASSLATMTNGNFIMAAGGWPIRLNGATIGGIGISGGNAPGRDDDIARAGLAAINAAPPVPVPPVAPGQPYTGGLMPQGPVSIHPTFPEDTSSSWPSQPNWPREDTAIEKKSQHARQISPNQDQPYDPHTFDNSPLDHTGDRS